MTTSEKSFQIRSRMLLSTASNFAGQVLTLGVGFFLTPFILHELGATVYGMFALVSSVAAYGALLDFGFTGAITKYVAEYRAREQLDEVQKLISTALWVYSLLGLVAIGLSLLLAPVFPRFFNIPPGQEQTSIWLVVLLGISIGVSIPCVTPVAILRGMQRFDLANLITTTGTLLWAGGVVTVLLLGWGVLAVAVVNIPITLLMQIPGYWLVKRVAPQIQVSFLMGSRQLLRQVIPFSSSIFVLNLSSTVQTKTDEIVIGAFMPIAAISPFVLARRLSEMPQILTNQFMLTLMPLASQLHAEDDRARLQGMYTIGTRLTIAIFIPLACILCVLASPILAVWVGAEYARYGYLVIILTLSSLVTVSQWPAVSILQGMTRHQPLVAMSVGTAVANLLLSIALVNPLGLAGVALGTLIPYFFESFFFVFPYALRVIGVSVRTVFFNIVLPAVVPAIPALLLLFYLRSALDLNSLFVLICAAGLGLLAYLLAYLVLNGRSVEVDMARFYLRKILRLFQERLAPGSTGS
jgi:O-antigen/teichoic acid export membrane protein